MRRAWGLCPAAVWHGSSRPALRRFVKTMKHDDRVMYTAKSFDHLRGLTGISDAQITEHLALYAGYVKQVNSLVQELAEMRTDRAESGKDFSLAEGTRRLAYEYDGMVLHELYFSNLKPGGEAVPSERQAVGRALAETYGSVDDWQANFHAIGGMRGIGWVILLSGPRQRPPGQSVDQSPSGRHPGPLEADSRHGRVGARVHARLQGDGAREVRRRLLQERRLVGGRPALARSRAGSRVRGVVRCR